MTAAIDESAGLLALAEQKPLSDYDAKVLRAVGDGAGTWMVAARMNVPTSDMRQRLCRLAREGHVHRSPRSSVNNIIWIAGTARATTIRESDHAE